MFRKMLEEDRRRAGWSVGQAAWRLGVTVREYRELEEARSDLRYEDCPWCMGGSNDGRSVGAATSAETT